MDYPQNYRLKDENIFGEQEVSITLYSPITVFVGANGLGKTQTLKSLRNILRTKEGYSKVRYLSSNRIGNMEPYRSNTTRIYRSPSNFHFGGKEDKDQRLQNESAAGDFFTLDEKKDVCIKVAERLSVLFKRQIYLRWDSGNLTAFFEKTETQKEYSVVDEASGLVNMISILAALYDNDVEVLLVDEPEVSLHPQLQSYILREMQIVSRKYGKTIILSTHSSTMIPFERISDISNIVFFSDGQLPKQISPNAPELNNRKLGELIMRMSQDYKEGFFAKRILLIEGTSDQIICSFLLNKLNMTADVAGSQIIPVDGKGQFPAVAKLFRLIGKKVAILTDLDAFTDDNSVIDLFTQLPLATKIANHHGSGSLTEVVRNAKTKINELLAQDHLSDLEKIYINHPYWKNRDEASSPDKYIRRSVIATLFSSSDEELKKWPNYTEWAQLKVRLTSLFDFFESLGCFILRRGTIESYYQFSLSDVYDEKPINAANEVSQLQDQSDEFVLTHYLDVVQALRYISEASLIDEAYAVRKELLTELALALEVLPHSEDVKNIYSAIKQAKGTAPSLFTYTIVNEQEKKGIKININSTILDVSGFPFTVFLGDNVNDIVSKTVKLS